MAEPGFQHELHFRDRRAPHEIQALLERDLHAILTPDATGQKLHYRAQWKQGYLAFEGVLSFDAALLLTNAYSLRIEGHWPSLPQLDAAMMWKQCSSWCDFWTRDFKATAPASDDEGSAERYARVMKQALEAEAHLDSTPAIQQAILSEMRNGRHFSTAHKEGGSTIRWRGGRFTRSDYGEWTGEEHWSTDEAFLAFLRRFYWHVAPDGMPDEAAWKLIYRSLG